VFEVEIIMNLYQIEQLERQYRYRRAMINASIFTNSGSHRLSHHFEGSFGSLGSSIRR
jgi:hypothetical protein